MVLNMFTGLLWCLFFGVIVCLPVQNDSSDAKQKEINKALGKAILKMLGLKTLPKPVKELKEKVPQYILDAYNNQGNQTEQQGKENFSSSTSTEKIIIFAFSVMYLSLQLFIYRALHSGDALNTPTLKLKTVCPLFKASVSSTFDFPVAFMTTSSNNVYLLLYFRGSFRENNEQHL